MPTDQDLIAAFIAKRGITRVAEGEATLGHMTARDWAKAVRTPKPDPVEIRRVKGYDHRGRAIIVNGLGELIAVE